MKAMNPTKKSVLSFFPLFIMAAGIFVFSTPVLAYEEDTHFQMTYVMLRSVGFTPEEALIVAAVDQGMDDSSKTVANNGPGGAIPNIDEEAWWHALDGYGLKGGQMHVEGIIARRKDLFQSALQETSLRNKLIRLGVFFHYQQDTWSHRHHYKRLPGNALEYDPNHLSKTGYITYNTPLGHAVDLHQPDLPPFDPVAALMCLEESIEFARQFLTDPNGLNRTPASYFAAYVPSGGEQDPAWPKNGNYFHQIRLSDPNAHSAHAYLLRLIRAQIDVYQSSPDLAFFGSYTAKELKEFDTMRSKLEEVCSEFESYRAANNLYPKITIPTTEKKEAQGFKAGPSQLSSDMLRAQKLPVYEQFVAVGTDNFLYKRENLTNGSAWVKIPDSGPVISVAAMLNGTFFALGTSNNLLLRDTIDSSWNARGEWGDMTGVIDLHDGAVYGIAADHIVYKRMNLWTPRNASWQRTNIESVISLAIVADTTLVGVGTDNFLYRRVGNTWQKVAENNELRLINVTEMQDGAILGVGRDNLLYKRDTLPGPWVAVPNGGAIIAAAERPLAKNPF